MMNYLSYETLIGLHVHMMRDVRKETFYGVLNEGLLRSALARQQQAAQYEQADGFRQAAYLFQGILMNHGFAQGNKRTAYLALGWFLEANQLGKIKAKYHEAVNMCLSAENEKWSIDQIDAWLRQFVR